MKKISKQKMAEANALAKEAVELLAQAALSIGEKYMEMDTKVTEQNKKGCPRHVVKCIFIIQPVDQVKAEAAKKGYEINKEFHDALGLPGGES